MIFEKLAKLVVKRHAAIIVIWLILLSISLPFIFKMGDVIAYQETDFVDNSYESQQASNLIKEKFSSNGTANSSMVMVIVDDNLTTPEKRDMILQLESDIESSSSLKYLDATTSIYDAYVIGLEYAIEPLTLSMVPAEEQTNLSLQMLYGIPENYATTYEMIMAGSDIPLIVENYALSFEGVNTTSSVVFGIPAAYLANFTTNGFNSSMAYNVTKAIVTGMTAFMDPANATLVSNYFETFAFFWNSSSEVFPVPRCNDAVNSTVAAIASNPLTPLEYKMMLWSVHGNLTLTNFMNPFNQSDVAYRILSDSMAPMMTDPLTNSTILGMLGITDGSWRSSFMTMPSLNVSAREAYVLPQVDVAFKLFASDMSKMLMLQNMGAFLADPLAGPFINPLLNITNAIWNESIIADPSLSTPLRLQAAMLPIHENFTAVLVLDPTIPPEELALLSELTVSAGNFGLSNYTNYTVLHSFIIDMISAQSGITNVTFLQEVFDLGVNASAENITALSWKVVREGTIGNYPIELTPGILRSLISEDDTSMLIMVTFTRGASFREANGSEPISANVAVARSIARDTEAGNPGLTIYVTGEVPLNSDMSSMANKDLQLIEPITISLVLILMGLFFRSVMGPIIPLAAIGIALGISQAAVFLIGTYVASVHFTVQTMLIAILFGVGTDYSIFILARYREELLKGVERHEAMRTSITWAGESIATSGATVIISFAAVSTSTFAMLTTMGIVLSIAVLIALLIALTLVPSIALMFKGKIFWPISGAKWDKFREKYQQRRIKRHGGYFRKAAKFATKHAVPIFIAAILISVPATYTFLNGVTSFDFINGMGETESVNGLNAMSDTFGAGRISPTQVVIGFDGKAVVNPGGAYNLSVYGTIENMSAAILSENSNVLEVDSLSRPNGDYVDYANFSSLPINVQATLSVDMAGYVGRDNTTFINVIYREEPLTPLSMDTTRAIRAQVEGTSADPNLAGAIILVGGESAALVDVDAVTSREFSQMEVIVMIGVFCVLLLVLGSIVLPFFAILSIGLSISWTLAVTSLLFGTILGKPVLWILPIIIFVILMGLGMDYNIFILTRVREEARKNKNHEQAIIEAVDRTGGIITACAVIMAGAFGSMMISNTTMLQEFGFALTFAVLLDAMVVRTYITPAIMKILGPKLTWYGPKRLRRLNPDEISNEHFEDKEY